MRIQQAGIIRRTVLGRCATTLLVQTTPRWVNGQGSTSPPAAATSRSAIMPVETLLLAVIIFISVTRDLRATLVGFASAPIVRRRPPSLPVSGERRLQTDYQ